MITLIITIIVIIILAAIAFVGMDDATGSAQYARFSSEFGDYATNFTGGAVTKVQESLGLAGKVANKAQIIYCAARGVNLSEFDKVLNSVTLPGGYTSEKFQTAIKDATGATYVLADANTPCYEIKDDVMKEYKGKSFYGNSNGLETHWVTASGKVFTLPGYPRTVDGEERMYISADLYYVPENGEMILASKLEPFEAKKIGDKTSGATIGSQEYADAADHVGESGNAGETQGDPEILATIQVGDFVDYTPDTPVSSGVYWRVWSIDKEKDEIVIMPTSPVGSLKLGESGNLQKCYEDWKNAVTLINNECKKYGSSKAKSIRSLMIEDFADQNISELSSSYKESEYKYEYEYKAGDYVVAYYDGSKNVVNNEKNVNNIIAKEGDEIIVKGFGGWFSNRTGLSFKQYSLDISYAVYNPNPRYELWTYENLLGNGDSWLSNQSVCVNDSPYASWGASFAIPVLYLNNSELTSNVIRHNLISTTKALEGREEGVRPLVTLSSSNVKILPWPEGYDDYFTEYIPEHPAQE